MASKAVHDSTVDDSSTLAVGITYLFSEPLSGQHTAADSIAEGITSPTLVRTPDSNKVIDHPL